MQQITSLHAPSRKRPESLRAAIDVIVGSSTATGSSVICSAYVFLLTLYNAFLQSYPVYEYFLQDRHHILTKDADILSKMT